MKDLCDGEKKKNDDVMKWNCEGWIQGQVLKLEHALQWWCVGAKYRHHGEANESKPC
jgi:hypothetical protein